MYKREKKRESRFIVKQRSMLSYWVYNVSTYTIEKKKNIDIIIITNISYWENFELVFKFQLKILKIFFFISN